MSDARGMAYRSPSGIPDDLRTRREVARLDLLALFRALDRMNLSAGEIPQRLLQQLFELDAYLVNKSRNVEGRPRKRRWRPNGSL